MTGQIALKMTRTMRRVLATMVALAWIHIGTNGRAEEPLYTPASHSPFKVESGSGEIFLTDINRDGRLDLITKHLLGKRISVRFGDGTGHFASVAAPESLNFDYNPGAVAMGDVNNDGCQDLGVASKDGQTEFVRIYLGSRSGGFSLATGSPFVAGTSVQYYKPSLCFADINGDGKLDVVCLNGRRNSVETFIGNGQGRFTTGNVVKLESGRWLYSFAVGDVDGDGRPDLVTAGGEPPPGSASGHVEIRLGDGVGGFKDAPGSPCEVGPDPRVATLADLNGDGRMDIVLGHGRNDLLTILLNQGKGLFAVRPGPPTRLGLSAYQTIATDINGDKVTDLVIVTVNESAAPFESRVAVLLGDGHGSLKSAPGSPYGSEAGAYRVAVGDINRDGKLDIATSSFERGTVTLLLGR
jgi:hypothetical protein